MSGGRFHSSRSTRTGTGPLKRKSSAKTEHAKFMKRGGAIKPKGRIRTAHTRSPEQRLRTAYNRIIALLVIMFAAACALASFYSAAATKNRAASVEYASEMYFQAERLYKTGNAVEAMEYLERWFELSERFGIRPELHQAEFYQLVSSAAEAGGRQARPSNPQP